MMSALKKTFRKPTPPRTRNPISIESPRSVIRRGDLDAVDTPGAEQEKGGTDRRRQQTALEHESDGERSADHDECARDQAEGEAGVVALGRRVDRQAPFIVSANGDARIFGWQIEVHDGSGAPSHRSNHSRNRSRSRG